MKFLYSITEGDILRFEETCKLNYVFVLNFLAFETENKGLVKNIKTKPVLQVNP